MKLFNIIEKIFPKLNSKKSNVSSDTRGVILFGADNIPTYKSLSAEDKKKVDEYAGKIKPENLKDIILYGDEVGRKSTAFADMLVNLFQQISKNADEAGGAKFTKKPLEEILKLRLNTVLAAKQLNIYKSALEDLSNEARLQTVALEKVKQDRKHRIIDVINIFTKSDIGRRKIEDGQLDAAIDRMRNSAQIAINQIQTVANSKDNMETMKRAIEVYKAIIPENDDRVSEIEKKLLEEKKAELLEMAKVVLPERKFYNHPMENEEEIEELARIQMELEIYAKTHKDEIDKIRTRIKELSMQEDNLEAKDKLLEEIDTIKKKYKVFGRRINEEDWKNFYQAKLTVLTLDINKREETPFRNTEFSREEIEWYKKIVDDKIQKLMAGENQEFNSKIPGKKQQSDAIKIIKKILQSGERNFDTERILKEAYPLKLLLAFDKKDGLGKMTLKKQDIDADFVDEWSDLIPLHSIYLINTKDYNYEIYTKSINVDNNMFVQLYKLYTEASKKMPEWGHEEDFNLPFGEKKVHVVPEGIISFNELSTYHGSLDCNKIVFPSTARRINTTRYGHNDDLYVVEFNEGLEEIGSDAFRDCLNIGRYTGIKFPATLRRIRGYAFYDCPHIGSPDLNEGLENIGEEAFWFDPLKYEKNDDQLVKPITLIVFPSTIKIAGSDIVNMNTSDGCAIGFKNYKGQEIPYEILSLLVCNVLPKEPRRPLTANEMFLEDFRGHHFVHTFDYYERYQRDEEQRYEEEIKKYIPPKCRGIGFFKDGSSEPYLWLSSDSYDQMMRENKYDATDKLNKYIKEEHRNKAGEHEYC